MQFDQSETGIIANLKGHLDHMQTLLSLRGCFLPWPLFGTNVHAKHFTWKWTDFQENERTGDVHFHINSSLRSKRSRTKRTKFGPSHSGRAKNRARAKMWKEGGGGGLGKEGNACPSFPFPTPFLPPFCSRFIFRAAWTPSRGPNFVRFLRERLLRRRIQIVLHKDSFCHRGKSQLFIHELITEPLISFLGRSLHN